MDKTVEDYLDRYGVREDTRAFLQQEQRMLVGESWIKASERQSHAVNEFSTGGVITHIPLATVDDVDTAVAAARYQFESGPWSQMNGLQRERLINRLADLMEDNAEQLAEIESVDVGKNRGIALEVDIQGSIDTLRYFAGWSSKLSGRVGEPCSLPGEYLAYTTREPVGVVGSIAPWNFPLNTLCWKLGATLATGCTTVIKPAELTSLSSLRLAELVVEAGFPPGVISILSGTGAVVGQAMSAHPGVDKLTFTGSTAVGKQVGEAAVRKLSHLTLELGGKSAVIVLEDVDIKRTAQKVAEGIFFNAGQVCDAGSRLYVQESIYRPFLEALVEYAATLEIGPGLAADSFIPPQVGRKQYQTVLSYIRKGIEEGAELVCGGLPEDEEAGVYVNPTVFANCRNDMCIVREEIFGPVLVTAPFGSDEDAVALANDSDYGLAAAVYGKDITRVLRLAPRLKAGTVKINGDGMVDPALPFGGYKQSGIGKDLGQEQLDHFLETKTVFVNLND